MLKYSLKVKFRVEIIKEDNKYLKKEEGLKTVKKKL